MSEAKAQQDKDAIVERLREKMGEIAGICSLIFLSDVVVIRTREEAELAKEAAVQVARGFGQILLYAFHPALHPDIVDILQDAGWEYRCEWPSAHPGAQGPMELWSIHTGQRQR